MRISLLAGSWASLCWDSPWGSTMTKSVPAHSTRRASSGTERSASQAPHPHPRVPPLVRATAAHNGPADKRPAGWNNYSKTCIQPTNHLKNPPITHDITLRKTSIPGGFFWKSLLLRIPREIGLRWQKPLLRSGRLLQETDARQLKRLPRLRRPMPKRSQLRSK